MPTPTIVSEFEKEVILTLLKQSCESASDVEKAVDRTFMAYHSFVKQVQALKGEMRIA